MKTAPNNVTHARRSRALFDNGFLPRKFSFAGFLLLLCLTVAGFAQDSDGVIRVETELVPFEVVVTDRSDKPVRGLAVKDFKLYEDGAERPIEFFEPIKKDGRPLSIVFALDVSGSVTGAELAKLREAMQNFTDTLGGYDAYFAVLTFGTQVKILQSFTNRADKLEKTFDKLLREQDGGSTHAYDAVDDAIRLLKRKSPAAIKNKLPKRAVILITDGFPVGDIVSPKTVIERANDAETSVYSVILPSYSRMQRDKKPLLTPLEASGILEKTGGRAFYAGEKSFEPLFKSLAEEITSSYVVAFYPKPDNRADGKFHQVRIEVPKGLKIKQNRRGYEIKQ